MDGELYISAREYARHDPIGARRVYAAHVRRRRERDASLPPAEQVPADDQGTRCTYCQAEPAQWAYPLDDESFLAAYPPGGFSPGYPLLTCDRCARLFNAGRDEQLLELFAAALTSEDLDFWSVPQLVAEKRDTLHACHAAAGTPVKLQHR